MKKIEFVAGYHEWHIIVDGQVIYAFDDFSEDITEDMTSEQVEELVDDLIYSWQMSFENDCDSLDEDEECPITPVWETHGEQLREVMRTAICQHYGVNIMKSEKMYRVIRDLQGGTFGMDRDLTIEQWREQAIEWADMDENDELCDELEQLSKDEVILFIANIWELEFAEVDGDGHTFQYEVNTVLNTCGEIDTSNTFATYETARQFYEKIGNDEMKELLKVDEDGITIEEIECNYGH